MTSFDLSWFNITKKGIMITLKYPVTRFNEISLTK